MARTPHIAARLQGFGTTIFAEMSALATATGALNLGQGFPDTDGPPEVLRAAIAAIEAGVNQYPPVMGQPDLRLAIAEHQRRFWGIDVDPDREIVVTAGATEAIAAALLALCETGDDVVVFDPTYDSYAAGIAMAGARIRPVPLRPPDDVHESFWFEPDELRRAFSPRTRLVLLNTPHNPTGKVFGADELTLIAELCVEHDVVAVADEVYEHLVFDGHVHRPLATFPGMRERTLTVSSGGKSFSFTGWKVGWACGPADLVAAVRTAKQFLTFVNAAPFQPAIAAGLRLPDRYFADFADRHRSKRDRLAADLATAGFDVFPTEGTYFLTADVGPLGHADGVEFCLALPGRAGVVAIPSAVFYQEPWRRPARHGTSLVRFCFAKDDKVLDEAGARLREAFA